MSPQFRSKGEKAPNEREPQTHRNFSSTYRQRCPRWERLHLGSSGAPWTSRCLRWLTRVVALPPCATTGKYKATWVNRSSRKKYGGIAAGQHHWHGRLAAAFCPLGHCWAGGTTPPLPVLTPLAHPLPQDPPPVARPRAHETYRVSEYARSPFFKHQTWDI